MPEISIRLVHDEERLEAATQIASYAFGVSPPLERDRQEAFLPFVKEAYYMAMYEDEKPVATAASNAMRHNIRGKLYPAGGIWTVAAHPAARRKGYIRQIMRELLRNRREDGEIFSTLYPFRESFYQRMGYVSFPHPQNASFKPEALAPLMKKALPGSVEYIDLKEGLPTYYAYLESHMAKTHGFGLFTQKIESIAAELYHHWLAIARDDAQNIIGAMLYHITDDDKMVVPRMYYDNPLGLYLLLEWFARHIDQIDKIEIRVPPTTRPETWWADLDIEVASRTAPMARVLDVAQLGGLPVGEGRFTVQIVDTLCPWNEGIFQFKSVDGALQVETTEDTPEFTLHIQALTALIYGIRDPATFMIREWGNLSAAQVEQMRQMFPPVPMPHLHEVF